MKVLRHPIRAIREPFGTAGLIVACVALVAALGGSAIAARSGLTGKEKKEVKKIAKKFAGKPGAPGAAGPAGPAGAKGDTGAAGANGQNGADGQDGTDGTNGTNGVSPIGTAFTGEQNGCKEGGVKFVGANTTFACNGEKGEDGESGFTATLPSGETETGAWAIGPKAETTWIPLSFNIPLEEAPENIYYVNPAGEEVTSFFGGRQPKEHCLGDFENPIAPAGTVCVYAEYEENVGAEFEGFRPSDPKLYVSGAVFGYSLSAKNKEAWGAWAVTAP